MRKPTREEVLADLERRWRLMDKKARLRQIDLPRERRFPWVNRLLDLRSPAGSP